MAKKKKAETVSVMTRKIERNVLRKQVGNKNLQSAWKYYKEKKKESE